MSRKTTIITGGAQGIGLGIATHFAEKGHDIILVDIDKEAGEEAVDRIKNSGLVRFIPCDVSVKVEVEQVIAETIRLTGRIDCLINNAGISAFWPLDEITEEDFDRVLGVNLKGAFLFSKAAASFLKKQEGAAIVNIASTRALMSEPGSEAYAASKGGLLALTHALAISLGPDVRVNAISPGWIEVGDWKKVSGMTEINHSQADKDQHPVGRIGTPEDVAKAAWFLCGEDSSFMTGQNLVLDGGMNVKMIYV